MQTKCAAYMDTEGTVLSVFEITAKGPALLRAPSL